MFLCMEFSYRGLGERLDMYVCGLGVWLSIPDICHNHHIRWLWRKNCHVEKIFHMTDCHVEKFLHMRNVKKIYHIEKVLHMINVEQNVLCGEMWRNMSCGEIFHRTDFSHEK